MYYKFTTASNGKPLWVSALAVEAVTIPNIENHGARSRIHMRSGQIFYLAEDLEDVLSTLHWRSLLDKEPS